MKSCKKFDRPGIAWLLVEGSKSSFISWSKLKITWLDKRYVWIMCSSGILINGVSIWKWKWCDMWPSMVTHTRNLCSAINPSKLHTHSSEHTHTVNTHLEQWAAIFMLRRPGSSWGFSALLKGTSVVVLTVERVLYIHSPTYNSCRTWDSNATTSHLH